MREAIGGALLIKLVMFFIVLYVCFLSIAINYSITFRVKNQIINLIESYEGLDLAQDHITDYISSVGYYGASAANTTVEDVENGKSLDTVCNSGYCIKTIDVERDGVSVGKYYKVTTYVTFSFPIINEITSFPVSGETRIIYGV